ncbi:uncharacterized protein JCM10292_004965 [Rhodotorula paludigena]|uniref:uncharacterized protein n=1 Tax=Rhodotorula paludigena TaxID=86838 RepID=UPI00316BE949
MDDVVREIVATERDALRDGGDIEGAQAGLVELAGWVHAARLLLSADSVVQNGLDQPVATKAAHAAPPPLDAAHAVAAPRALSSSASVSPASPAPPSSASPSAFGFAPPAAPGELAKKLAAKKTARLSAPAAPSKPASQPSAPAPAAAVHSSAPAAADVSALRSAIEPISPFAPRDSTSPRTAGFPDRMAGLASLRQPVSASASTVPHQPLASTSSFALPSCSTPVPHPSGPPSAGFAPPPAPGTAFEPKKKARKSRAPKAPRRTSDGILKGRGVSEVYVPPAREERISSGAAGEGEGAEGPRPSRKRKAPLRLTFEQSSDPLEGDGDGEDVEWGGSRGGRRKSAAGGGKRKRFGGFDDEDDEDGSGGGAGDEDELDELASDYEEQVARRQKAQKAREVERERSEELNRDRFAVGSAVMCKFPNYSWFPAIILDPQTAPSTVQGKRVKGAYLVKSIPSGADHRWVAPDKGDILPIQPTQLDDILLGRYKSPPPQSWIKWRGELVEAVILIKDPERLKDWLSRPTELEEQVAAKEARKNAARMSAAW